MIEPLIVLVGVASVGLAWLNHHTNPDNFDNQKKVKMSETNQSNQMNHSGKTLKDFFEAIDHLVKLDRATVNLFIDGGNAIVRVNSTTDAMKTLINKGGPELLVSIKFGISNLYTWDGLAHFQSFDQGKFTTEMMRFSAFKLADVEPIKQHILEKIPDDFSIFTYAQKITDEELRKI